VHQSGERSPSVGEADRRPKISQGVPRVTARIEVAKQLLGGGGAHPWQQLQRAKRRKAVFRIVCPAQNSQHVFHVSGFEELETAVLHVGNVPPGELELQHIAMVRAPEQDRLPLQRHALLTVVEHARNDVLRLLLIVGDRDVFGAVA